MKSHKLYWFLMIMSFAHAILGCIAMGVFHRYKGSMAAWVPYSFFFSSIIYLVCSRSELSRLNRRYGK